jgi:hypothetical protein
MSNGGDIRDRGLLQIFAVAAGVRRVGIVNALMQAQGASVLSGPFAGMKLLPEVSWGDGDLPPKLLGCYEEELHPAIAKAVARGPSVVVNIGCAEGYYAVGMARMLPQARVFAFESDAGGQEICRLAGVANQVGTRLVVAGKCEIEALRQIIAQADRPLLVVDCEGAELQLLDIAQVPEIRRCDMIIECHDFVNPRITSTLRERFATSHDIEEVLEGSRNPNKFNGLRGWGSMDRWLAVNEGRPVTMNWLVCWAR